MKKWQYKVVPLKGMADEDPSNHSVDVSVEGGRAKAETRRGAMEQKLNELGKEGWELVCSLGEFALLKKEK